VKGCSICVLLTVQDASVLPTLLSYAPTPESPQCFSFSRAVSRNMFCRAPPRTRTLLTLFRRIHRPQICPCSFVHHSRSADRVLPVLPSLEYASNDFLLAVAAPAAAVERYRRLRLHRALGNLPSDVSLTPALPEARAVWWI